MEKYLAEMAVNWVKHSMIPPNDVIGRERSPNGKYECQEEK